MPSIIEGYNYDIFISYRQKDNKHDGWVTEFVNQLKGELEATFKEDISIYFDENPSDGLLETHSVDKSLEGKLRCLIFIPIISRTYCDPKSYAWQYEFYAFNKISKEDRFGRDIRLSSGNVASRILPVKIHDLDPEDKSLIENELGGVLRGIEFIYKEAGVDRPLTSKDNEEKNLNRTNYRNQINKVALAIKELLSAIKHKEQKSEPVTAELSGFTSIPKRNNRIKILTGLSLILLLIVLGILFIPKLIKPKEQFEKSIAVLPFKLLSDEPDKQYLADGMMDAITLHLSKIKDLRVMSRTSVEQYRGTTKTTRQIGKELGVEYLLEGSFQKFGDNARLIVQLIKTGKEGHIWANDYDRNWSDIFKVQSEVAQKIADELHSAITPEEKQLIEKIPTTNLTAYDFYQRGIEEHTKFWLNNNDRKVLEKAEDFYHEALKYDSTYAQSYIGLAKVYWDKHYWDNILSKSYLDSVLILCNKALSCDNQLSDAYTTIGDYDVAMNMPDKAIKEYDNAIRLNPNDYLAYWDIGGLYFNIDRIMSFENIHKAIAIYHGPFLTRFLRTVGKAYLETGFFEKAKYYYNEAFKLDKDTIANFWCLDGIEFDLGNLEKDNEIVRKIYAIDSTSIDMQWNLGLNYMFLRKPKEALKLFKEYLQKKSPTLRSSDLFGSHRIGWAYYENGNKKEAEYYLNEQINYCNKIIKLGRVTDIPSRQYYDLAGAYAFKGERIKAYENLRLWAKMPVATLWWIMYLKNDPLFDNIRNEPEFQQIARDMEAKYQAEHERVRKWLEEQGML